MTKTIDEWLPEAVEEARSKADGTISTLGITNFDGDGKMCTFDFAICPVDGAQDDMTFALMEGQGVGIRLFNEPSCRAFVKLLRYIALCLESDLEGYEEWQARKECRCD